MSAWENAINRQFIKELIDWSKSLKKDYSLTDVDEFYKELGRHITNEINTTFGEDITPE